MGIPGRPVGTRRCSLCEQLFRREPGEHLWRCRDCVWDEYIKEEIAMWKNPRRPKKANPYTEFYKHFPRPVSWKQDMGGEGDE